MAKSTYVFLPGLKAARLEAGIDRSNFAAMIGVSPCTLAAWEQCRKRTSTGRLPDMAAALKASPEDLQKEPEVDSQTDSLHVHAVKGLKAARNDAGLYQKELAEKIGIGEQEILRWEKGYRKVTETQLHALASALKVEPEKLLIERRVERRVPIRDNPAKEKNPAPVKLTYKDIKPENVSRPDSIVRSENYRFYYKSKKNPKKCECCGTRLSAFNKKSKFCYAHVSPDSRMEYRKRLAS